MFRACLLIVLMMCAGVSASRAQSAPPSNGVDAADCYFKDALVGVYCRQSIFVRFGVSDERQIVNQTTPSPFHDFFFVPSATSEKNDSTWVVPSATVVVTPTDWLKLSFGSEYTDFYNTRTEFSIDPSFHPHGGQFGFGPSEVTRTHNFFWNYQTFEASAKVFDSGPGASRYLVHVFAGVGVTPDQPNFSQQWLGFFGGDVAGRWRIGGPYSLDARGTLELAQYSYLQQETLLPSARLLLSRDDWGWAIGPETRSVFLLRQSGGVGPNPAGYFLGADAIIMPFKTTRIPVLRNVQVSLNAEHTLGKEGGVPLYTNSAQIMNYSGTVGVTFRY